MVNNVFLAQLELIMIQKNINALLALKDLLQALMSAFLKFDYIDIYFFSLLINKN
jgi:hypothetical protein